MTSEFRKTWMKQAKEATKNRRGWTRLFQKVITHYEYVVDFDNLVYFLEPGGFKCFNFNRMCVLQAYCSILYLKPTMQIILRGQKVKTQLVSKSLAFIEKDIYRPKFLSVSLNISIAELDSVAVVLMNFGLLLFGIFLLLLVFLSHTEGITSIRPTESNSYFLCSLRFTLVFLNICSKAKTVRITFGFNCRNKDHYGIMMYHKNRLIKAYERVGCQLKVRK